MTDLEVNHDKGEETPLITEDKPDGSGTSVYKRRWWVFFVFAMCSMVQTGNVGTSVYKRHWWVFFVFAMCSMVQALMWNTWGPVTESSEAVFGWDDSNIGMLANYGNIAFMITVLPLCYFMDVKGLRIAMLLCTAMIAIGVGIRCITLEPTAATWTANIAAVLFGAGGSVPFAGPALLSSIWFPPDQRATATAGISFANYLGVSVAFIIGPQLVSSPKYRIHNVSHITDDVQSITQRSLEWMESQNQNFSVEKEISNMDVLKHDIMRLMYVYAGLGGLVFLLVVVYFPDKPPLPPSYTASVERVDYIRGFKSISRNKPLWLIIIAYAAPTGVLGVWSSVLDVNLKPLGISQKVAGYMGFWQTLAGAIAGLVIARFSDIFMRRMKTFLITLFIGAIGSSVWFLILCEKYISFNLVSLYTSCILMGVFVNGAIPLFYEISCEASYPVSEGLTGGVLTLTNNLVGVAFLFVLLDKSIGTSWMNWVVLGSIIFSLPLLFLFPERYRRTDLDIDIVIPKPSDIQGDVYKSSDSWREEEKSTSSES